MIHVGIDDSWRATGAVEWAVQEARLRGESLSVVHVIEDQEQPGPDANAIVEEAAEYLAERLEGVEHSASILVGPPAATLARSAADSRMLVVGRRGDGLRQLLIGSMCEAVAITATVPVVVVPERWTPGDHLGPVIVGVDGTDRDSAALAFAAEAAAVRKQPLRLVHVWYQPAIYSGDLPSIGEEWWQTAKHRLECLADELRVAYPDLPVETEIRSGRPVPEVVAAATDADAQLLVIGGRNRRWPAKLPGSVTRGLLEQGDRPLAVVHDLN